MPDILQANVTPTLAPGDSYNPPGMPLVSFPSIAFGGGGILYPTNGVPLPDMGKLGAFKKAIKRILITPAPGDGLIYKYDKTYNTIRIYEGNAIGAITIGANTAGTPTGNVAAPTGNVAAPALTIAAPTGNVANLAVDANTALHSGLLTMQAPTGNLANTVVTSQAPAFTGDALANHTHTLTGAGGSSAAALAELGHVAVAATVLDLMVIGE